MGKGADTSVLQQMMRLSINFYVLVSLFTTICFAIVFVFFTDGFYGTLAPSFWSALHPTTSQQSDDVYPCQSLNGQGSYDDIAILLLVLLTPLFIARCIYGNQPPGLGGLVAFGLLSLPFLVMMFGGPATCGDIPLTLYVGKNVALALCLAGWIGTLMSYLVAIFGNTSS